MIGSRGDVSPEYLPHIPELSKHFFGNADCSCQK
jgi:hypothetical protein